MVSNFYSEHLYITYIIYIKYITLLFGFNFNRLFMFEVKMGRKLVKQGKDALTISLPRKWLNKYNLNAGDELELEEKDNHIILSSKKTEFKKRCNLNISNCSDKIIYTMLNALYIRGEDEIEIKYSSSFELSIIKRSLINLVGFVVVKETDNICSIKDMGGTLAEDIDEIIKRIFVLINIFIDDAKKDIESGLSFDIDSIIMRDSDVNKLVLLSLRTLNKKTLDSKEYTQSLFSLLNYLENVSDEIARLWKISIKYKIDKENSIIKNIDIAKKAIDLIFEIYYRFSKDSCNKLIDLRNSSRNLLDDEFNSLNDLKFIYHINQICERCVDMMQSTFLVKL
jgi:phosphate uptake regulator